MPAKRVFASMLLAMFLILAASSQATAQQPAIRRGRGKPLAGQGVVNLPYIINDNLGNQFVLYQAGILRQQGNMPLYSQAGMLMINNSGVGANTNQARLDEKTGEVVFENMVVGTIQITRRLLVSSEDGYVRYIDIFKNTQGQDQSINVSYTTNFNYQVMGSQMINDTKGKERALGVVAAMQVGRAIMELYGGRGAKDVMQIQFQPENNMVRASMQISVPGNKEVAIVHLHGTANTQDAGAQFIGSLKDAKLLADVPPAMRKLILNFGGNNSFVEDREVLRGDVFDVIEMRSGDIVKGTIQEPTFTLNTFYGDIELPADRVVGLINVGQFRPRQLLVTVDGEVFGGSLGKATLAIELSSGQVTQVPLSQISRAGSRKRPNEPEEWKFDKPMVMLRTGERIGVIMPEGTVDVLTRYGLLKLRPESIGMISFQSEDHGVHEILLTDGSEFAGLVSAPSFNLKLSSGNQTITIPAASVRRIQLNSKIDELDDDSPTLSLSNNDSLTGTLSGQMKLDTTFDTITIDAAEVRSLARATDGGALDVQVTLWDQTVVSGQLQQPEVVCALNSGIEVQVPVALVSEYSNPQPKPSATMIDRIKSVVAELSTDDWKQRERAEAQLVSMGPVVVPILKEMSPNQPPEAQQRIDSVLKQLEKTASLRPIQPAHAMD